MRPSVKNEFDTHCLVLPSWASAFFFLFFKQILKNLKCYSSFILHSKMDKQSKPIKCVVVAESHRHHPRYFFKMLTFIWTNKVFDLCFKSFSRIVLKMLLSNDWFLFLFQVVEDRLKIGPELDRVLPVCDLNDATSLWKWPLAWIFYKFFLTEQKWAHFAMLPTASKILTFYWNNPNTKKNTFYKKLFGLSCLYFKMAHSHCLVFLVLVWLFSF